MDAQNDPAKNVPDAGTGGDNMRWHLILLVLCAVGAVLVIGILALQVTEYLFYKAPPNVWPQPGVVSTVSAPAALVTPPAPVKAATSLVTPAADSTPVSPTGQTSVPAVATVSASVPKP